MGAAESGLRSRMVGTMASGSSRYLTSVSTCLIGIETWYCFIFLSAYKHFFFL